MAAVILLFVALLTHRSAAASSICPLQSLEGAFVSTSDQCSDLPLSRPNASELDGRSLDRVLNIKRSNTYVSVLFYADWCPFSRNVRPTFNILASMFPHIRHVAISESTATPSVFSRYGVHSLPTIVIANRTSRLRYNGPKDLNSLVQFYKKTTGFEPEEFLEVNHPTNLASENPIRLWHSTPRELVRREAYLALAVIFLLCRAFLYIFPKCMSWLRSLWMLHMGHLSLGVFGERSLLVERALHVFNIKRVWSRLRLCKTRNFEKGAKNARVWASSLASVSIGEASSTRSSASAPDS
ncbi:hypothetical protein AMTRI_Chr03g140470 [Amborella trichopoda]